jgi:glycosyltransferase involved in cell wall biosynthesis
VLFVGTLQLRKGLPYLLEALRQLSDPRIKVRLVGPSRLSNPAIQALGEWCHIVGSVPRDQVAAHYHWADVFVLPTLSEGSANVVYEAMAAGLAVVTTPNAGSVIRAGEDGLLVPIRDVQALANALRKLTESDETRARLGQQAQKRLNAKVAGLYTKTLLNAIDMD